MAVALSADMTLVALCVIHSVVKIEWSTVYLHCMSIDLCVVCVWGSELCMLSVRFLDSLDKLYGIMGKLWLEFGIS